MPTNARPELISFALCPFVQRSVITLLEKGVTFDTTYIDLAAPPAWFLEISPFGKVPVLRVGNDALFESAVINEYLDDVNPPAMHPADPLTRAHNRAWIEFGSQLMFTQYNLTTAANEDVFEDRLAELTAQLGRVASQLGDGPYFNGDEFSLIDAAYAPLFQRLALLDSRHSLNVLEDPRLARWSAALLERPSVPASVKPDFADAFIGHIRDRGGYGAEVFG